MILLRNVHMRVCCLAILIMTTQARQEDRRACNSKLKITHNYQAVLPGVEVENSDIHTRSLSAWTWRINFEENRIPKAISEAVCSSSNCKVPKSGPRWTRHEMNLNSVPVPQDLLVLRFNNTLDCYQVSFISVTVGCTCVQAQMA